MELDPQESPGEIKRRGVDLGFHKRAGQSCAGPGGIKRREVELDPQESPGEIKSREVEQQIERELDSPLLQLFLNSCFPDTVFVTLLRTAVETAISKVPKLLRTGGVPTSLTLLFCRWLTVSSVFAGRSARTSYSRLSPPPHLLPLLTHSNMFTYLLNPCSRP